jgi:Flp pilus assembly protein TadG
MMPPRPRQRRRGANHIEFALLLPVLLLFIYGIMEYGWVFFHRTAVQEAGRQGCRHGATLEFGVADVQAEVSAVVEQALQRLQVDCDSADCRITTALVGEPPLARLRCTVSIAHNPLIRAIPTPERLSAGYLYYFEVQ